MSQISHSLKDKQFIYRNIILHIFLIAVLTACGIHFIQLFSLSESYSALILFFLCSLSAIAIIVQCFPLLRSLLFLVRLSIAFSADPDLESDLFELHKDKFLVSSINNIMQVRFKRFAKTQEAELAHKNIEFSALQSQINPHFLYNTLESIRSEAIEQNVPMIAEMVRILSSYYRYCIDTKNTVVTFKDELQNLKNYFHIQRFRFGSRISLNIKIRPEDQVCLDYPILKMTLQPIAENAIFHGLEHKVGDGILTVCVELTKTLFLITVSDNGIGMPTEQLDILNNALKNHSISNTDSATKEGNGVALINVNRRIKIFFGDNYGLTVHSIPRLGTDIEILLPVQKT